MFDGLRLPVEFHKEKVHMEEGEEVLKDGDKWFLVAGAMVLATITYQKYVNFSIYTVECTEYHIDGTANPYPHELRDKNTLQEAKEAIRARLKVV
jgi:hypothetical protein